MKVTYIITTFNRPELLERAVGFVARERCVESELIVVDDHSRPVVTMPERALEAFPGAHQLIRNQANLGVIGARNVGISAARGEYLLFLDDDDESMPDRTRSLLAQIDNTAFNFVAARSIMQTGEREKIVPERSGFVHTPEKLLLYPSHINAIIWRREMFRELQGMDDRVPYLGEHISLILNLLHGGSGLSSEVVAARFEYIETGLTEQTHRQNSLKDHLTRMYQVLLEESETPGFRQLCDKVLAMLRQQDIRQFDEYLQLLRPIIQRFVSLR